MFKNFIRIALRNLKKNKLFSFVNIFGLSLSLAVCLLIIAVILDQNGFDRFHPNPDNTYRINTIAQRKNGDTEPYASSPLPLAAALTSEHPFITNSVRLQNSLRGEMLAGGRKLVVRGFFTEPSFFELFGFELLQGHASMLHDPRSVLVSEETARRFFGSENPVGKTVQMEPFGDFTVAGIVRKPDSKTHIEFDMLGSLEFLKTWNGGKAFSFEAWKNYYNTYTYVTLSGDASALQAALDKVPERFYRGLELESRDAGYRFEAQRLDEITPGPILSNALGSGMPRAVLIFLGVLAGIGMFAAAFNYANLTLARATTRAREVGIRKVSGATRGDLFGQFVGESVVVAMVSLLAADGILRLIVVPAFRTMSFAADLDIRFNPTPEMYLWFVFFTLAVGLTAGLLPAWILSSFKPAVVVKDVTKIRLFSGLTLRKLILTVQFAMTMILLIVLTTIYRQSEFSARMDYYGFHWQNTINVELAGPQALTIAGEMARFPGVESYTFASHPMGTWADSRIDVWTDPSAEAVGIRDYSIDENFIRAMKLSLVAGEDFQQGTGSRVIVNERFVQWMQAANNADAVGKTIYLDDKTPFTISGVVKDFVFKPVTYELEPLILRHDPSTWSVVHFKLRSGETSVAMEFFRNVWKKFNPSAELQAQVYANELTGVYNLMNDLGRIIGFLSLLVLTIAMLGLLGVVSYGIETRTREIGIRKIMGATRYHLVRLLSGQYLMLMLIAAAFSLPISLLIANKILTFFAYRIDFGISLALPSLIVLSVAVALTIGSQALRGANANPVEALRNE